MLAISKLIRGLPFPLICGGKIHVLTKKPFGGDLSQRVAC